MIYVTVTNNLTACESEQLKGVLNDTLLPRRLERLNGGSGYCSRGTTKVPW